MYVCIENFRLKNVFILFKIPTHLSIKKKNSETICNNSKL